MQSPTASESSAFSSGFASPVARSAAAEAAAFKFKVVLLGSAGVGKTSLVRMAAMVAALPRDKFDSLRASNAPGRAVAAASMSTVGVDFTSMSFVLPADANDADASSSSSSSPADARPVVTMCAWDTGGMERFAALTSTFVRDACAIVLVYDINQRDSFEAIRTRWQRMAHEELQRTAAREGAAPLLFLLGNKTDLTTPQCPAAVSPEQHEAYAHMICAAYHGRVCAHDPHAVYDAFNNIARWLHATRATFVADAVARRRDAATFVSTRTEWVQMYDPRAKSAMARTPGRPDTILLPHHSPLLSSSYVTSDAAADAGAYTCCT
jgi:GTPase SAR1 family protein